jgi:hypothetical protein
MASEDFLMDDQGVFPYRILAGASQASYQWEFQDPKWRYLPYIRPIFQAYVREDPHKAWPYMGQYLHFRILEFPLIIGGL